MNDAKLFEQLGVSLLLGLLVGLQREHVATKMAGLRTFRLITALGTLACILDQSAAFHGILVAAGLLAMAAMVVVGKIEEIRQEQGATGLTTAVTALLIYTLSVSQMVDQSIGSG
jgi:uncharacterized membrane protein YhiD involved in acid resistance